MNRNSSQPLVSDAAGIPRRIETVGWTGPLRRRAWKGLLWCEWFAHSKLLLAFLGIWLATVWFTPLFASPAYVLFVGVVYAFFAGPAYGGGDVIEGCEEFTFALPATRNERYLARCLVGGGTLLGFVLIDVAVLGLDLHQSLARLYVDVGLMQPKTLVQPYLLYGLVIAFPAAGFAFSFALSAATHYRLMVFTSWFWGGLGALALLQLGCWYEEFFWDRLTGYFSCPFLAGAALAALVAGYRGYRRKEVGHYSVPLTIPGKWWLWIVLFLMGLAAAAGLIVSLARHYPRLLSP